MGNNCIKHLKKKKKKTEGLNPSLHLCLTIAMKFSMLDLKSMSMEIWKPYLKVSINKETKILNQKFNKNQMIKDGHGQKKDLIIITD